MEAGGEVVGAALGQIAQKRGPPELDQAGDHLVQRPVAAHGHDQVVPPALPFGGPGGVAGGIRDMDGEQVTRLGKGGGGVEQGAVGLVLSGPGVDDHQKLAGFHQCHLQGNLYYGTV